MLLKMLSVHITSHSIEIREIISKFHHTLRYQKNWTWPLYVKDICAQ